MTNITGEADIDTTIILVQAGYLFPSTAWEIAARFEQRGSEQGAFTGTMTEIAAAMNYYLNGHGNKMSLDVTIDGRVGWGPLNFFDVYTGIQPLPGIEDNAILIRFQWQLAL